MNKLSNKNILRLSVFVGLLVLGSSLGIVLFTNNTSDMEGSMGNLSDSPLSADLQHDVQEGDVFYYRVLKNTSLPLSEKGGPDLPPPAVEKYVITYVNSNYIEYDVYTAPHEMTDGGWDWAWVLEDSRDESYQPYQVFGHMFAVNGFSDIAAANGTDIEDLNQAFADDINASVENVNVTLQTSNGLHYAFFEGYIDDIADDAHYESIEAYVNVTTGYVVYIDFNKPGEHKILELMGFELENDRYDWGVPNMDTFGYSIGDEFVVFRPNMDDHDHDDGGESSDSGDPLTSDSYDDYRVPQYDLFIVKFIYYSPKFDFSVIVFNIEQYYDAQLNEKAGDIPFYEGGRVEKGNATSSIGQEFHEKDLTLSGLESDIADKFESDFDLDPGSVSVSVSDVWHDIEVTGTMNGGVDKFYFYVQLIVGYGYQRFTLMRMYNGTEDKEKMHMDILIRGDGFIGAPTYDGLSLGVGDWFEVIEQFDRSEYGSDDGVNTWDHHESGLVYKKYTVTDLIPLNRTVIAVIGSIEVWTIENPTHEMKGSFEPFLIYDTQNPVNFLISGGLMVEIDGPPIMVPTNLDVTDANVQQEIIDLLPPDFMDNNNYKVIFTENSMRLNGRVENDGHGETNVWMIWNDDGVVTHFEFFSRMDKYWDQGWFNRYENSLSVLIDSSTSCDASTDISQVTNLQPDDNNPIEMEWNIQRYDKDENNGEVDMKWEKFLLKDIITGCDGSVVFLGSIYGKKDQNEDYKEKIWLMDSEGNDMPDVDYWILGIVEPNDIWSWMGAIGPGRIFDIQITDFTGHEDELAAMLNYAFMIPDEFALTESDIMVDGLTFKVSLEMDEDGQTVTHVLKFAVNEEGLLQDVFQGTLDSSGNWIEWERVVLISGPGANGEVFTEDIPDNYEHVEPEGDGGLGIDGYPMLFSVLFAFGAVAYLLKRRS